MIELLAACGAWVFVFVLRLHNLFHVLNRKPFACEVCMAGWFALVLCVGNYHWLIIPFKMAAAMVITILLTSIIKKI